MSKIARGRFSFVVGAGLLIGGVVQCGVAVAQPDFGPLINTTCTYAQVTAALAAEAPDLSSKLQQFPMAQTRLQKFLAAPVDQRQQMLQQANSAHPQWRSMLNAQGIGQQDQGAILQVANTCNSY